MSDEGVAQMEMPKYRCHKEVWALQIAKVDVVVGGAGRLTFVESQFHPIEVDAEYMNRHRPQAGGYYVVYKGGYKSFSPADAFEDGYTLIE